MTWPTHVRSCRQNWDGLWIFVLEDGQAWIQRGRKRYRFKECDFDVVIKKDFFGYTMDLEDGRSVRIRRPR